MFNNLILLLLFIAINFPSFPECKEKLNPEFYRTWLRYEFYQDIMEGKTPLESMKMQPIMQLYFYPDTNLVLIGSFNEGMHLNYVIKSSDSLIIYERFRTEKVMFVVSLTKVNFQSRLIVDDGKENMFFKGLDEEYYYREGVKYFVNDKLIAGEYVSSENPSTGVCFFTEGQVEGLNDYSKYDIPLVLFELPNDFDTIILRCKTRNSDCPEVFHWKRSGNSFILYYLKPYSNDVKDGMRYYNAQIGDKYIELVKVE